MSESPVADQVGHTQAAPDQAGQPAEGQAANQKSMAESRNALIGRDLNDIYLLLDHLSGRPDRHVSTLQLDQPNKRYWKDPPDSSEKPFITRNLIQSVCEIEWPPNDPNSRYSAIAATTLFTARDILNDIAAPASGMTIAFTIMVIDELKSRGAKASRSILRRKTTTKSETTSYNAAKKPYDAEQISPKKEQPKAGDEPEAKTPVEQADRTKLAKDAYPHLEESAKKLGGMIGSYNAWAIVFIVFAAVLSWNVASGKLILERLNDLKLRSATEAARIITAEQGGNQGITISTGAADYVPDAGSTLDTLCDSSTGVARSAVSLVAEQKSDAGRDALNVSRDALCEAGYAIIAQRHATDLALASWYGGWAWVPFITAEPPAVRVSDNPLSNSSTKNFYRVMVRDAAFPEQQAGDLNTILASYVLPMIYGLVGAAAAVIRGLNRKMLESSLAPRDISASRVQLLLGVIIGACIGLFVSPTGAPDAQLPSVTLAGNAVALSASAFSFIAGFGVEAVFKWIETLIAVAFAAGAGSAGSSTTTLVQQARRQAG